MSKKYNFFDGNSIMLWDLILKKKIREEWAILSSETYKLFITHKLLSMIYYMFVVNILKVSYRKALFS